MPERPAAPKVSARSARAALRPNVSRAVRLLIRDISRQLPEFSHVRSDRILVVAGEARRASRATIRPMRFPETGARHSKHKQLWKPRVTFRGQPILYVITLRPLFFRNSSVDQRIETILHELFHLSQTFNGTLDPQRRHSVLNRTAFSNALRPLIRRYLALCPEELRDRLAFNGEVRVRQWLEKPPRTYRRGSRQRRVYDETQTFLGPVRMITRTTRH
jgi:predicted metallopeptidase